MRIRLTYTATFVVLFMLLWKDAIVMPDGRVAGIVGTSLAMEAEITLGDYVRIVDGKKFNAASLPYDFPSARYVIVDRVGEGVPIMTPNLKER